MPMEKYYTKSVQETEKILKTDIKNGLSAEEARKRLDEYGENIIEEKAKKNIFIRFISQFNDFMIIVLLAAAFISFVTNLHEGENAAVEPIIILGIVIVNSILGVFQEYRAEKSIEKLKSLSSPHATVIRDGKKIVVDASTVVPGDIIVLTAGDVACADGRIAEANSLETDESGLTGESVPVAKKSSSILRNETALGDRENMIMSGSSVISGSGIIIATATGMRTEVGNIAGLIITSEAPMTPLQKRLAHIGKVLGITALLVCAVVFVMGINRRIPPIEMFINSVSLAVAAIPEGLPAIITIMLAVGVRKMAARRAVMKNLPSVETLGSATVICADKTGTLTLNKMKVKNISSDNNTECLKFASLCCEPDTKNPTELAITEAFAERSGDTAELHRKHPILDRIPFSSERKRMSTLHKIGGEWCMITKGAPDYLLRRCTHFVKNGETVTATGELREMVKKQNDEFAGEALRVIAVAKKTFSEKPQHMSEEGLTFIGLIAMSDPPRPEAKKSVALCREAGIRPVMITGDHMKTAYAIANEIGICESGERVVSGEFIDRLSDDELKERVGDYDVYARVTPLHKMRIIKAWQSRGEVVAMTGDGVNDAPALKAADIGCCPGKMGTDVARAAADMIVTDDNFATIVDAVKEGRTIFANIKKAVKFLLSSNLGEIITVFGCLLAGAGAPLGAIALLWVNLVTDSLPATALSVDPPNSDIMHGRKNNKIFDKKMISEIVTEGGLIGALTLFAYTLGRNLYGAGHGSAMCFSVLSISQLVHAFNMRSEGSVIKAGIFKNRYLVISFILGVVLQLGAVSLPAAAALFSVEPIGFGEGVIIMLLSFVPLLVCELQKIVSSK